MNNEIQDREYPNGISKIISIILAIMSCSLAIAVFSGIMRLGRYSDNVSSNVPSKFQVFVYSLQHKHESCEQIGMVRIQADERKREPAREIYTYKSKKRDMLFHIISTLDNVGILGETTSFYRQRIYDDFEISEGNQMSDELWIQYVYNRDYNSIVLKIPVAGKDEVNDYIADKYGVRLREKIYLDHCPSLTFKDMCGDEAKSDYIRKLSSSTAAVYVSDVHVASVKNKYTPYIWYDEISISDKDITLQAEMRDYKDTKEGDEAYYVGVVFISVDDESRKLAGEFK